LELEPKRIVSIKSVVTAKEAQANLPGLLKRLPGEGTIIITNRGCIAGYLVSKGRMEAI
jgi:hypothetical protein